MESSPEVLVENPVLASLEVATLILIPRSDDHGHCTGSYGDVIFLINQGEVHMWLVYR